jgi:hypothetical protein
MIEWAPEKDQKAQFSLDDRTKSDNENVTGNPGPKWHVALA